jgi:hypothetical protein
MTEHPTPDDESLVVLNSLPSGGLSMEIVEIFNDRDVFEMVGPLIIDTTTNQITHLNFAIDDRHHFIGWNPTNEQWEQIIVVVDEKADDGTVVLESAIRIFDDETGELALGFDQTTNPSVEDVAAFVWEYVEYTHPETDRLFNVMDEALDELRADLD